MAAPSRPNTWFRGPSRAPLPVLAAAVVVACALPLLTGAADEEPGTESTNRARIESMTELERRELEQRFARYRELSSAERDRLRTMHDRIQGDAELSRTVAAYRAWLSTVTPIERERLRNEADPRAKLAIVERIRARQREEERSRGPFELFAQQPGGGRHPPKIDPEELDTIYGVLEKRLDPESRKQVESKEGTLARQLETLRAVTSRPSKPPQPGERFRPPRFPDDETLEEIRTALSGTSLGRMIDSSKSGEGRRARVVGILMAGVWQELGREWERRKPDDEELRRHFTTLPAEEQDRLKSLLSKEEFERELMRSYVVDSTKELGDVRRLMQRLSFATRMGRPPFGGGRGGRPDEGGPGDRQGPFGRPGGGRRPGPQGRPGGERREPPAPDDRVLRDRLRNRGDRE